MNEKKLKAGGLEGWQEAIRNMPVASPPTSASSGEAADWMTDERAAFEKYMSRRGNAAVYAGDGMYEYQSVQELWECWQARASATHHATAPASDARIAELTEALRNRNDSAHREREKLVAHIHKLETALWKMGTAGETALKEIRSAAPASAPSGETVHQVASTIHPKGWFDCDVDDLEGHQRAGFKTRTLYANPTVAAQASAQQGEWDGDDFDALRHLSANFTDTAGVIQPKPGYSPTSKDYAAIDYLCNEWDYAYATTPKADAQQGEDEPPLPEPDHALDCGEQPFYRPDQMRAYARTYHARMMRKMGERVQPTHIGQCQVCVCGDPTSAGVVHRTDGPCYVSATTVPASESIDTPEFRELFDGLIGPTGSAWPQMIAHINAWHVAGVEKARAVPEGGAV